MSTVNWLSAGWAKRKRLAMRSLDVMSRFAANKSGNVAIIFGVSLFPLLMSLGIVIDYSRGMDEKSRLDAAIDAAVLFASTKAAQNGYKNTFTEELAAAQSFFNAQVGSVPNVTINPITLTVGKDPANPGMIKSTAYYSGTMNSWMRNPFTGNSVTIPISGSASSEVSLPSYIDFYLMLDNSPSMGLAASPAEITRMRTATTNAGVETCEFACHTIRANGSSDPNDNYAIARKNSIKLRVDLLAEATQSLTQMAEQTQNKTGLSKQFRMGIYPFNRTVTALSSTTSKTSMTSDNGITDNLPNAGSIAAGMSLAPYLNDGNYFLTDFTVAFSSMNKVVSNPGDGRTSSTPQKYVFFITDGVQDLPQGWSTMTDIKYTKWDYWGHTLGPVDPKVCNALKDRGIKVAVLYTTYYATAPGASPLYDNDIAHWAGDISTNLRSCASPGLYYVADTSGIKTMLAQMFTDAVKNAKLTK